MIQFGKPDPVYIVDGVRTPFLKVTAERGSFSASDLAVACGRTLLARMPFSPDVIDETIVGCVMPSENEANIARIISIRLGCSKTAPAWTVQRNCASGMQALDSACQDIAMGRANIVLAGGTEAMSHAPLLFKPDMVNWFGRLNTAKTFLQKMKTVTQFHFNYLSPTIALLRGLSDPLCGMNMGQTAELLAYQFQVSRKDMDVFAARSQQRAVCAQDNHWLSEIASLYDARGKCYVKDEGVRRDSTLERLGKLKPAFDKAYGMVTAGNSSQITDGAALLILASEKAVMEHHLPVLGKIVDTQWAAFSPEIMGLGPVFSSTPLLQKHRLALSDIDHWEINEAFAAQVTACLKAWESDSFCREQLKLPEALGSIDPDKINIDGGAIAVGHPVGATGARLVLHLLKTLHRKNVKRGIATLCIGGGQGGAMLVEKV